MVLGFCLMILRGKRGLASVFERKGQGRERSSGKQIKRRESSFFSSGPSSLSHPPLSSQKPHSHQIVSKAISSINNTGSNSCLAQKHSSTFPPQHSRVPSHRTTLRSTNREIISLTHSPTHSLTQSKFRKDEHILFLVVLT